jgi:hypothetical protein
LNEIEKATSIRVRFLRDRQFEPGPGNVAEKMGWAARRITSRGEDRAYSLMGLFGVSLSTAYGEGLDQAFSRLIEAIIQVSNNPDVLNWAGEPAATSHPTRMIPSSPDCYLNHPKLSTVNSPQSLVLTNRGLQLKLLVVRAENSTTASMGTRRAVFHPMGGIVREKMVEVEGLSLSVNKGGSAWYAFGVWNLEDGLNGEYLAPPKFIACLMTRMAPNPWKRIPTKGFIVLTVSPSLNAMLLDSLVETVFL